jgi:glutamyl-tRNA synthetase
MPAYREAIDRLIAAGDAYPCVCSRKEVEQAASAPHAEDGGAVYPGTCRGVYASIAEARSAAGREPAIRFRVPDGLVSFQDEFRGQQSFDAACQLGDFVIAKADGTPAYQLAVVVDDVAMNVTDVIRGDDLVDSTPRQILLYRALGWQSRIPRYTHGDTRLSYYRGQGIASEQVLNRLAAWCGIERAGVLTARDLIGSLDLGKLSRQSIIFNPEAGI